MFCLNMEIVLAPKQVPAQIGLNTCCFVEACVGCLRSVLGSIVMRIVVPIRETMSAKKKWSTALQCMKPVS